MALMKVLRIVFIRSRVQFRKPSAKTNSWANPINHWCNCQQHPRL